MVHKLEMTNKYLQYNKYYVTGTYNTRSNYQLGIGNYSIKQTSR